MLRAAALLFLATILLAACGSGNPRPGQQAAAATPAPTATPLPSDGPIPDGFIGVWTADLQSGTQSHGLWTLRITENDMALLNPAPNGDHQFFSIHPRAATTEGVSFYDDPECLGASYRWQLVGDSLTFTSDHADSCVDRYWTLTGEPWHRTE